MLVERLISRKNTEGNGKESTYYSLVRADATDAPLHTVTARGSAQYGLLRLRAGRPRRAERYAPRAIFLTMRMQTMKPHMTRSR